MKNYFTLLFVPLLFTSLAFAQMQLKLVDNSEQQFLNTPHQELQSNMQLNPPSFSTASPDAMDFYKGLIMLGILADVTFPMGGEEEFGHIAGTGFSGHVVLSYLLSPEFIIALRAGYIKYSSQTEEGEEQGFTFRYEDNYSQIPILLGGYYLIANKGSFKPYLGLALGIFLQNYSVKWEEEYFGQNWSLDESFTNTGFGIVPEIGFYYLLGSVVLQASAGYNLIFSDAPAAEYGDDGETYTEDTGKANSISVNVGLSFPIGGK